MTKIKHKDIDKNQNDRQWTRNGRSLKRMKKASHKRERLRLRQELRMAS